MGPALLYRSSRFTSLLHLATRSIIRVPLLTWPCAILLPIACLLPIKALAGTASITTLAVTASGDPVATVLPQTIVALTATVTSGGVAVSPGVIDFCDALAKSCTDIHLLGTAQLTVSGTATLRLTPSAGTHSYKAVFAGTTRDQPSVSVAQPLQVGSAGDGPYTSAYLSASGIPGNYTLTESLTASGTAAPTGTITFRDTNNADYALGTAALSGTTNGLSLVTPFVPDTDINPIAIVAADFNGDGKTDLAVSGDFNDTVASPGKLSILLGNGDGTFAAALDGPLIGEFALFMATGDFNADGIPDLAVVSAEVQGEVDILLGKGDGTFTNGPTFANVRSAGPIVTGDFNGDGNADLAFTETVNVPDGGPSGMNFYRSDIVVFLGNGDGTFTSLAAQSQVGGSPSSIIAADLNGDGKLDLAISGGSFGRYTPPDSLTVLLGNGDGTFTSAPSSPTPTMQIAGIVVADFNGDGIPDLAASQPGSDAVTIFTGNGDGTYGAPADSGTSFNVGIAAGSMSVADFTGKGNADIAVASSSEDAAPLTVLLGGGDGTFTTFTGPNTGIEPFQTAIGDFNGDGRPDIAVANYVDGTVSIFLTQFGATATATVNNVFVVGTGRHLVDASYPGDASNAASVSNTVSLVAEPVPTTLTLTASPASSSVGQPITLTARITPDSAQNHTPSAAPIDFYAGGALLAAGVFADGVATMTTTALPPCTNVLAADFLGDANFLHSSAPELTYLVTPAPSIAVALSVSSLTVKAGRHSSLVVTVAGTGLSGPVSLTATSLPQYGTVIFSPQAVLITTTGCQTDSHTSSIYLDTDALLGFFAQNQSQKPTAPGVAPDHGPYVAGFQWSLLGLSSLALLPILRRRSRRWSALLFGLLAAVTFTSLTGCANRYPGSVKPGTYVIQIRATAQGSSVTASAPLTLIVTP